MPASYAIKDWSDVDRSFRVVASTSRPLKRVEPDPSDPTKKVEFFEALEGWDFRRYEKNNLVLESHNTDDIDAAIGLGSDLKETADGGLEMRVTLAPLGINARSAEIEKKIKAGYLRGVSVGWECGDRTDEQRGGKTVRVYRNNKLTEVSLCLIPADEDGLIDAEEPDEESRKRERASNAARLLASRRTPAMAAARTDSDEESGVVRFDFVGDLGKFSRTQVGGLRVPARLTRIGVLEYRLHDGTIRRELRHPDEVFNADSLATLAGATVTDLEHHRGLIDVSGWKDATLGHTENARQDGKFIAAELLINDSAAIADLENGRLHDISCGYSCKLDFTPGVYEGERYDAIQRRIRYNHVAVLPKGKGRAGTDVALRLDAKDARDAGVCVAGNDEHQEERMEKVFIKLDGKNVEEGSKEHITHLETALTTATQKWETEKSELTTRCDKAEGKVRAFEKKEEDDKKTDEEGKRAAELANSRALRGRLKLIRSAVRLLDIDEDDEEKVDALEQKDDRALMLDVIRADAHWKSENFDDRSNDYVSAIYDSVSKNFTRSDGVDSVVDVIERVKRTDAASGGNDPEATARQNMNRSAYEAWTKPLST
jgi:uncharacterized protein